MSSPRPIVTFTTDFGLADAYVAEMKAAVLRECRDATLVDVTHLIPPQDVLAGSIVLERAVRSFPAGTIHVAVVDPGVGSERKLLVVRVNGQTIIAPDNGLITWTWRRLAPSPPRGEGWGEGETFERPSATNRATAPTKSAPLPNPLPGGERGPSLAIFELLWRPVGARSHTFHGRDILGPAAGLIAYGRFDQSQLRPLDRPVLLNVDTARSLSDAKIIHIDHYGNVTTNVPESLLSSSSHVDQIGIVLRTYADVSSGEALALIGSSGLLEIAIRNGSAASKLGFKVGDTIDIR